MTNAASDPTPPPPIVPWMEFQNQDMWEKALHLGRKVIWKGKTCIQRPGDEVTSIFLIREGRVIDSYSAPLEVRKVGLERWLYRLAFDQPLIYGLMSLLIAAVAGWGASAAFRALQRE